MQPLLLFFIDGARLIDSSDPEWDMLLAVHTKGEAITVVWFGLSSSCNCVVECHYGLSTTGQRWQLWIGVSQLEADYQQLEADQLVLITCIQLLKQHQLLNSASDWLSWLWLNAGAQSSSFSMSSAAMPSAPSL